MESWEKLGVFYLGRAVTGSESGDARPAVLYDSRDLTTHAVILGMTGSGKTGLGIGLLEEAGMDRIPALVIDPKGDLANLLLTFPELSGSAFLPWIDPGEADRAGQTPEAFAAAEAERWTRGLADWGQTAERIARFRETVELRVYTPGSASGRGISLLASFAPPGSAVRNDPDALRERIMATASSLLALVGVEADPLRSREHILLAKLLEDAWGAGRALDMPRLIREIQTPPFTRLGILELEEFFPSKDRTALALAFNTLLASPTFAAWLQGDPLDIGKLLYTADGAPCISIVSIAHLSDAERMFFVTLLLNEVVAWVRTQAGTPSLRAVLYMDEVQGFFPPVANPPSKPPMLTLLKQARAFGLGVVLATQNPIDLDYKGLGNIGSWFLGRLQTARDKARVLEGLAGAGVGSAAGEDGAAGDWGDLLAGLQKRQFLLHNVHEDQPIVFETRWTMSYLRGPLSRSQLQTLASQAAARSAPAEVTDAPPPTVQLAAGTAEGRLQIPPEIPQWYLPPLRLPESPRALLYVPAIWGEGKIYFAKATAGVECSQVRAFVCEPAPGSDAPAIWSAAHRWDPNLQLTTAPPAECRWGEVPPPLTLRKNWSAWEASFREWLYRDQELLVWKCRELNEFSRPGETVGEFRTRLEQRASEQRDQAAEKLRQKYAAKLQAIRERIQRGEHRVARETEQYQQRKRDSWLHAGATILGAVLGRKKISVGNVSKASTTLRTAGRAADEKADVDRAQESLQSLQDRAADLEAELQLELASLAAKLDVRTLPLEEIRIRPKKADTQLQRLGLVWIPWELEPSGQSRSLVAPTARLAAEAPPPE